ncbi:tRNA (guanine-N(7)-)-methyltransferase non-catalytic subunit trm82 [Ascochyta rabiei]|uniref:RNA (Guanine-N7)-methylation n=1 Tax=Didymella rabiei TaxID=5454 RepID=A0A162VM76_DIDRA|nr:tRNA (guanine-N(7)-)-methyltransferase non-catalytic subunit trm82 [Ascochyta rabiei]KZM18532.1 RNA (guanine-N7)-methylation [Ascochyta rabiei]UPX11778.1 tRNA (guanine-N(7)-)-methyltransferase non-catalytic subunit trm82 [Ascochyta rabiei]
MSFPYQCLIARESTETGPGGWTLFGACGSTLVAQSSSGGTSTWSKPDDPTIAPQPDEETDGPPEKKVKLSEPPKQRKANFSNLIVSHDGKYVVGVTGEDKCIRVFETDIRNQLRQLSERCMTRRPCSITLTSDDSTILCADKFGDVYSLPLLPSPDYQVPEAPAPEPTEEAEWVPSATVLTVHSGRNRKTLEDQLKQKKKGPAPPKDVMTFEHRLLLGHVSMLTDIVNVKVDTRSYIITADRDEHIRISRGLPQAHIIEGFCFGHEAFINKLCLTQSDRLVSGGGDAELYVWDWQNFKLLEKLPILDVVASHLKGRSDLAIGDVSKVAVSGIWSVPGQDEILVACEGVPALFSFMIGASASSGKAITLKGNALDIAFLPTTQASSTLVVSIDHVYKSGSTKEVREDRDVSRLHCFSTQGNGDWQEDSHTLEALRSFHDQVFDVEVGASGGDFSSGLGSADDKALRDMLYNVENLRKRPGAED